MIRRPPRSTLFPYTTSSDLPFSYNRRLLMARRLIEAGVRCVALEGLALWEDRKSTRLNSSHTVISYAVFCLKKKKKKNCRKCKNPPDKIALIKIASDLMRCD